MNENRGNPHLFIPALLLIVLICTIYSNTLNSGWYLDDYQNITHNPNIQISRLSFDSITDTFYAMPGQSSLDRPFAYFTFALNWYWGQDEVAGYRIVNISIHILAAIFLFITILLLFQTPNLKAGDPKGIYFVAFLAAILWAIHPIQIQAVTYIVQRMASMAALFYIIGIFCYLKARITPSMAYRTLFFALCGIAFLLSIASKNNAIMLPVMLLIMEFVFFQDLRQPKTKKLALAIFTCGIILVIAIGTLLFMEGNFGKILGGYEARPFTLYQRLLTQPSVVLFYLSQVFYPIADRFSITHDHIVSTSLFTPWTTLPAIIVIVMAAGLAIFRITKNPVLSFAIIFFLLNHIIESSIIPLEMVFEHRNYLPTMFLFVPIAAGIQKPLDYYSTRKPMFAFLVISVCVLIIGLGMSTYIRNDDWRSHKNLWEDAMRKAPSSGRPLHNLAWGHYEPRGQVETAIMLYQKAVHLKFERKEYRADPLSNLASIYYLRLNDYEKAAEYALKAIEVYPDHRKANLLLCHALAKLGRYDDALLYLDNLLDRYPNNLDFLYLKGNILLQNSQYDNALKAFQKCLKLSPGNWKYLREIGITLTKMKYHERGNMFLKWADAKRKHQAGILLGLAENRIMAGQTAEAAMYIDRFIELVGEYNIEDVLMDSAEDGLGLPISFEDIVPFIVQNIQERSVDNQKMAERLMRPFSNER